MRIIIDSREKTPLDFPYEFITEQVVEGLPVGDYTCMFEDGFRPTIIFERKSIPDLFGTLGKGHKRFKKEIERAKRLGIQLIIIIEKPLSSVLKGFEKSDLKGETIVRKLFTIMIKYNVGVVFCKDREEAARYIYEFFCAIGRLKAKPSKPIGVDNAELPTVSRRGDIQAGGE